MRKNNRTGNLGARMIAMSMTLALAVPQAVVPVSNATSSASVKAEVGAEDATGSDVEELKALIRANLVKDYDAEKDGEMDIIHWVRSNTAEDALTTAAQNIRSQSDVKSAKYTLYDINKDSNAEMIIRYNGKKKNTVRIYRFDDDDIAATLGAEFTKVSEIRTNTKKKQIVIVEVPGKNKKTITTCSINASGKLKTVSVYKKSGKTYKKGSKKIKKKAFNKFAKSVNKLSKLKLGTIPKDDYNYVIEDECFYGNGLFSREFKDDLGKETLFMTKTAEGEAPQDKYLAYSYAYDQVGWREYTSDPFLTRYVFGPDVVDPKTGKTYQQEDWEAMSKEVFGGRYAPPFLTEATDENGKPVLDIEADGAISEVEVSDIETKNGDASYKGKEYAIMYGDGQLRMTFITEGPLTGRIAEAGLYFPQYTGDVAHDEWEFIYQSEAGNAAEHDPTIYDCITAGGVDPDAKVRSLTINAASDELKQTIKSYENVRFELYGNGSGEFYTTLTDGKDYILPFKTPEELSEADKQERLAVEEAAVEFEKALNPPSPNGQNAYADSAVMGRLFWRAKQAN